jgi:hypothetical protein
MIIYQIINSNQIHLIPILCFSWYVFTVMYSITWLKKKKVIFFDKLMAILGLLITPYFFRLLFEYIIIYNNLL